jgi:pyridoxal/pyridoxine/pyridoxamine kinase
MLVLGDNGKLYVKEELVKIYREEVIPNANFLFPNQTECE